MRKWRFFLSILKERDWLEQMAAQGWFLTDITAGVLYHFRNAEPCEKVFEIDRFAVSKHATAQELNARMFAVDVASQSGWEIVTHDEEMNYYFMKDKAGDETDELYDADTKQERAERYRKHYSYELPAGLLALWLIVSLICVLALFLMKADRESQVRFMWFYLCMMLIEIGGVLLSIVWGQRIYGELCLNREEWELRKRFGEKKTFNKVQQLRSFLQEKSEFGLSLVGYENGVYLFEEDICRYNYFVDTKSCLKKRLKQQGIHFKDDSKDWSAQSLKWYEMSMTDAAQYGLKPVGVIQKTVLIYKRPYSEEPLPWENGNENIGLQKPTLIGGMIMICVFALGFAVGFFMS